MEIVLVRHGKPNCASNLKLDAQGFRDWIESYENSNVNTNYLPPDELSNLCVNSTIISSALLRSIHSTKIVSKQLPSEQFPLLNEMLIPSYFMPFKMRVSSWLLINRMLWLLGFSGNVESYKVAKQRARLMVNELEIMCEKNIRVVVFGHGLMNRHIGQYLAKSGWQRKRVGKGYWAMEILTKD